MMSDKIPCRELTSRFPPKASQGARNSRLKPAGLTFLRINQEVFSWVISQTDPLPPLDSENKKGTMFFLCSHVGGGHVEDIRGRGGGVGVDHAFRRDDRGLGAADSPALRQRRALCPDRAGALGKSGTGAIIAHVPRGLPGPKASPLRGESAEEAARAPSSASDRRPP